MEDLILSPEEKIITLCARRELRPQIQTQIERLLDQGIDWQRLTDLLNYHHITTLVSHHLARINHSAIPKEFLSYAETRADECTAKNLLLWQELNSLLSLLKEKDIKAMPMKGILFIETLYKNIALREMTDLDILVQKKDVPLTNEAVRNLGYNLLGYNLLDDHLECEGPDRLNSYQKFTHHLYYQKIEPHLTLPLILEIHYDILLPIWNRKKFLQDIWVDAEDISISGMNFLTMSLEDSLVYLSTKTFMSFPWTCTLKDLCDISEFIRCYGQQVDWDKIIEKARSYNVAPMVYYSLFLTKELKMLEGPFPPNITLKIKPSFLKRAFVSRIITKKRILTIERGGDRLISFLNASLFDILSMHGFRETFRSILNILYRACFKISKYKKTFSISLVLYGFLLALRLVARTLYRYVKKRMK